jgi:Polysaccharide biosynthesis protein
MTIIAGLSLPIARFYDEPRLIWITVALSTSFFCSGPAIQHQAILTRMITCGKTRRFLAIGIVNSLAIIVGICLGFYFAGAVGVGAGHVLVNYVLFLPVAYFAFADTPISLEATVSARPSN